MDALIQLLATAWHRNVLISTIQSRIVTGTAGRRRQGGGEAPLTPVAY
jgi:hypothetical protein